MQTKHTPITQAQLDYEADVARKPRYNDGTPRKTWEQLSSIARDSWQRGVKPAKAKATGG